jgi:hypothetical protein
MHFGALQAIRDRLRADPPLADYFAAQYPGLPLHFFIGLKPDLEAGTGIPADLFPYIAVSPLVEDKPAHPGRERTYRLSLMFGVNDDRLEDGVFLGIQRMCEIGELILQALAAQPIGTSPRVVWSGEAQTRSDAGVQHPYYEGEILLPVQVRP